jgi:poly-gamma-glutamate capsule biosynthesis protein CapA/YwtB (metallophosphatase superfamily)
MRSTRPAPARLPARSTRATVLVASDWAPIRAFDPIIQDDPLAIYGDVLPILRGADLRIVNCECALTTAAKAVWKSGAVFKGEPGHVRGLTAVPFDVACLANNHVLDFGVRGLRDTIGLLHRQGIRTVGAGGTEADAYAPLRVTAGSLPVHVVNISEGEDLTAARGGPGVHGWDVDRASATIRKCKRAGGAVIAIAHCGLEYVPFPPPYVVAAFRALVDAGADAVVGHHPHVPQGIEWRRGRPIVYSLGNFVFYQPTPLVHRKTGYCVTLHFERTRVAGLEIHPYRIGERGLRLLVGQEARRFRKTLDELSHPFATPGGPLRAWHAYLSHYGQAGFVAEVAGILERMRTDPQKAAAMFRNRLTTAQHSELWRDLLTAAMAGKPPTAPAAAVRIVRDYFTKTV